MAYIPLDPTKPGMRSLLEYYPAIAAPLTGLMQVMMRSDEGLNRGERELIAACVSAHNHCMPCEQIHSVVACQLNKMEPDVLETIKRDLHQAPLSDRIKSILDLATQVALGSQVTSARVSSLKAQGCSDREIHDTVLIAALFCMYNRYIDGLGIISSDSATSLLQRGDHIARYGYSG